MTTPVSIGERMRARRDLPPPNVRKALRVSHQIGLRDMGREVGVSPETIRNYENGSNPRPQNLVNYVRVLQQLQGSA